MIAETTLSLLMVGAMACFLGGAGRGALVLLRCGSWALALPRELAWAVWLVAGLLALHGIQQVLHAVALPWSLLWVTLPLTGMAVVGGWDAWRGRRPVAKPALGWGDAIAMAAVATFTWATAAFLTTNPDFIYHWGIKGHRFFLSSGVDLDFLMRSWNRILHPDYPLMVPGLFAWTSSVLGEFDETVMLLWSVPFLLAIIASARACLRLAGASALAVQGTTAALALVLTFFGVSHLSAGGPDPLLALALVLAGPALVPGMGLERQQRDLLIALAAALAAVSKLEGAPLAAFLVLVYGGVERLWRSRQSWLRFAVVCAPGFLLAGPWVLESRLRGLDERLNAGPFNLAHGAEIFPALWKALLNPHWHGVAALLLAAAIGLLGSRRFRPWVLVSLFQLGLYIAVYFTDLQAPGRHVLTSFTRVLSHFVPAWLIATSLFLDIWAQARGAEAPGGPDAGT